MQSGFFSSIVAHIWSTFIHIFLSCNDSEVLYTAHKPKSNISFGNAKDSYSNMLLHAKCTQPSISKMLFLPKNRVYGQMNFECHSVELCMIAVFDFTHAYYTHVCIHYSEWQPLWINNFHKSMARAWNYHLCHAYWMLCRELLYAIHLPTFRMEIPAISFLMVSRLTQLNALQRRMQGKIMKMNYRNVDKKTLQ